MSPAARRCLSVLFYYAAYCVFPVPAHGIDIVGRARWRCWCCSARPLGTKQHTLTLPLLLLMTDLYWAQGSLRANRTALRGAGGCWGIGGRRSFWPNC